MAKVNSRILGNHLVFVDHCQSLVPGTGELIAGELRSLPWDPKCGSCCGRCLVMQLWIVWKLGCLGQTMNRSIMWTLWPSTIPSHGDDKPTTGGHEPSSFQKVCMFHSDDLCTQLLYQSSWPGLYQPVSIDWVSQNSFSFLLSSVCSQLWYTQQLFSAISWNQDFKTIHLTLSKYFGRILPSSVPWRPMPSILRWQSAPPSDARRQHSCRPVHSRRLYHRRQAVVHAEWTLTKSGQVRSAHHGQRCHLGRQYHIACNKLSQPSSVLSNHGMDGDGQWNDPIEWGWKKESEKLIPIMTNKNAAPDEVIHCNCSGGGWGCKSARCNCKRDRLSCTAACGPCQVENCDNPNNT